jgi:hypothetical protein
MSKGVESVLVTKQEIVILLRAKTTMAKGVPMAVKVRCSEPKFNQQNGNIVRGVPKD